jgi:hypothetical protein
MEVPFSPALAWAYRCQQSEVLWRREDAELRDETERRTLVSTRHNGWIRSTIAAARQAPALLDAGCPCL